MPGEGKTSEIAGACRGLLDSKGFGKFEAQGSQDLGKCKTALNAVKTRQ